MTFKAQQVLRTKIQLRGKENQVVPAGTRVVVMGMKEGRARVKVADPLQESIASVRLTVKPEVLTKTHRGRPKTVAEKAAE
jgi:hypothetical protein